MDWSPHFCLPKAETTPSGLLKLDGTDQEVELLRRTCIELRQYDDSFGPMCPRPDNISFKTAQWIDRTCNLTVTVTTHRIVLGKNTNDGGTSTTTSTTTPSNIDLRFIHLSNVIVVNSFGGPTFTSPFGSYKIKISTYTYGDILLVFRGGTTTTSSSSTTSSSGGGLGSYQQSKNDRDATFQQLDRALTRKQWETQQRLQERVLTQNAVTKRRVGVDHIMTKNKISHQQAAKLAQTALSGDAEQLLQEAAGLLKVIQKYTVLLERYNNNSGSSDDDNDNDDESARKLATLLSDMGMTSALTKSQVMGQRGRHQQRGGVISSSQQDYYELTARQLADFLLPRLTTASAQSTKKSRNDNNTDGSATTSYGNGIITLTDVYCLFNRARGTNLISPEDLREACSLLGDLKVGLSQRIFPSGVIVIQLDSMALDGSGSNTAAAKQRLLSLCPTSALEASHTLHLSPLLALEQLEEAERLGWLCRDTTLETVRFCPNKFNDWV